MHFQRVLFVVASLIGLLPMGLAAQLADSQECWSSLSNSQTGARVTSEPSETILPT